MLLRISRNKEDVKSFRRFHPAQRGFLTASGRALPSSCPPKLFSEGDATPLGQDS